MAQSMVLDLWGSQTMRTGGEEIGTALALLGVKPVWDHASFRVTGFEIVPLMKLNRPRVDVTLAHLGAVARHVSGAACVLPCGRAARCGAGRACERKSAAPPAGRNLSHFRRGGRRLWGGRLASASMRAIGKPAQDLGESYLAASSTAYTGEGEGVAARAEFERRVKAAEGFVHVQDHRETDMLSSLDFAAHEGGFAAAASAARQWQSRGLSRRRGRAANAARPKPGRGGHARSAWARVERPVARRADAAWLSGARRRSRARSIAAFAFAATAGAIGSEGLEHLYEAYLGDPTVASFLARENGAALAAMQSRFKEAIARSLWKPRRNDLSGLEGGASS